MNTIDTVIGVIGNGFVGQAVAYGLSQHVKKVLVYDTDPKRRLDGLASFTRANIIFVCVPTPQGDDGTCDTSHIHETLSDLDGLVTMKVPIVIKSSVPPMATRELTVKFPNLAIIVNPEFLTQRTAIMDFAIPSRIVIGHSLHTREAANLLADLYRETLHDPHIIVTALEEAELIKYMSNCFYSVKISFMNEMKQIFNGMTGGSLGWEHVMEGFLGSGRVARSHTNVPGPDGEPGFGGKCLPKDLAALIKVAENLGEVPTMLKAAQSKNQEIRKDEEK
jgi:UDPglucose 6-dehydrogenase